MRDHPNETSSSKAMLSQVRVQQRRAMLQKVWDGFGNVAMIDWIVLKEAKKEADTQEASLKEKEGAGVALKKSLAAWTEQTEL